MKPKTKKALLSFGAIFVAVIFLTGFIVSGGGGSLINTNTQKKPAPNSNVTVAFASGTINASITGYGSAVSITLRNRTNSTALNAVLTAMENNGTVETYNQIGNNFKIYLSSGNASAFISTISNSIGANTFNASLTEYLKLPSRGILYNNKQPLLVDLGNSTYPIVTSKLNLQNSTVKVFVNALVAYENNTVSVYENNITINMR